MLRRLLAAAPLALALAGLLALPPSAAAVSDPLLTDAVDQNALGWLSNSSGGPLWTRQTTVTHDGSDAARSGSLADLTYPDSSWIETTVTRPATLRWWWYAEPCLWDRFDFTVDGADYRTWNGSDTAWKQNAYYLGGTGAATIRWLYWRSASCSTYGFALEAGFLDQVEYFTGTGEYFTVPTVEGPEAAAIGRTATYGSYSLAANNEGVEYLFEWDGSSAGENWGPGARSHTWDAVGPHTVRVQARCTTHQTPSDWSPAYAVQAYDTTLETALDEAGRAWATGGNALWFGEGLVSHDGADAAQTEPLASSQSAWVETSVTGPGLATFWWKVSSEENADYLTLTVDGDFADRISGEVGWEGGFEQTYDLGPGAHTLRWTYAKDGTDAAGSDRAWLDQFSFAPETTTTPSASGPGTAIANVADDYSASGATNSSGHTLEYEFGYDGVASGVWGPATQSHAFAQGGERQVRVRARCSTHPADAVSAWSDPHLVTVEKISRPARPSGETAAWVGFYPYSSTGAASSSGHPVEYQFSFNGSQTGWLASPSSGVSWTVGGAKQVLVRARCAEHTTAVSAWSLPLAVTVLSSIKDTFADGSASGDPHWRVVTGSFAALASAADAARGRRWVSAPNRTSLALFKPVKSFSSGRITSLVKLVQTPGTTPMAEVFFQASNSASPGWWRYYVRVLRDRIVLGEVGDIDGDGKAGTLATKFRPFTPGVWYRVQIDIRQDRKIQVRVGAEASPSLSVSIPMIFYSQVGVRSTGAQAMWDDFLVQDSSRLPAPEGGR